MAKAEYKFTNKNENIRGRIVEVVEFAKARGIFIKQMEVYRDPDALKDTDTTHEICDFPPTECEEDCCSYIPAVTPPSEEEVYENLRELFAKVFGFDE